MRRHNPSSEIAHLVAEVRGLTTDEALEIHGIEIADDKSVYDTAYELTFDTLIEWATYVIKDEMYDDSWDEEEDTGKWNDDE